MNTQAVKAAQDLGVLKNFRLIWDEAEKNQGTPSYHDILSVIGNVVLCVEEGDYQGDYFVLFTRSDEFGYLCVGYGSCSGCDSLQACDGVEDFVTLGEQLKSQVKWDSAGNMLRWIEEHDWKADFNRSERFERESIEILKKALRP